MKVHYYYPYKSDKPEKKYYIITKSEKKIYFGAAGYSDMTQHKNEGRKNRYILRHEKNEDWGKSKMEIIAEAQKAKAEDERKAKLFAMLEEYQQEDAIKKQLKAVKSARDATIKKMLDNAVL